MEANIGPERVVVRMLLLIWMPVKKTHSSVRLQASLLAKDQQGTRPTDLQVIRQQEGDGFADKRTGYSVTLHITELQGPGTELNSNLHSFTTKLEK